MNDSWIADRRLYLTADKRSVAEHDSPEAAFLLVGKGGEIPMGDARRYGLVKEAVVAETKEVQLEENKSLGIVKPASRRTRRRRKPK